MAARPYSDNEPCPQCRKKADNELNAHHAKPLVATAGRAAMVDQATQTAKSVEPTPRKTMCESPKF